MGGVIEIRKPRSEVGIAVVLEFGDGLWVRGYLTRLLPKGE